MYITLSKLVYPNEENLDVIPNDGFHDIRVMDSIIASLTHTEAITLYEKLGFSIQEIERQIDEKRIRE